MGDYEKFSSVINLFGDPNIAEYRISGGVSRLLFLLFSARFGKFHHRALARKYKAFLFGDAAYSAIEYCLFCFVLALFCCF